MNPVLRRAVLSPRLSYGVAPAEILLKIALK